MPVNNSPVRDNAGDNGREEATFQLCSKFDGHYITNDKGKEGY